MNYIKQNTYDNMKCHKYFTFTHLDLKGQIPLLTKEHLIFHSSPNLVKTQYKLKKIRYFPVEREIIPKFYIRSSKPTV